MWCCFVRWWFLTFQRTISRAKYSKKYSSCTTWPLKIKELQSVLFVSGCWHLSATTSKQRSFITQKTKILITQKVRKECDIPPLFLRPTNALQASFPLSHFFIFSALVLLTPLPTLSLHSPPVPWWLLPCPGVNYVKQQLDRFSSFSSEPIITQHLKMGLTRCSWILVTTYQPMPCSIQEEKCLRTICIYSQFVVLSTTTTKPDC